MQLLNHVSLLTGPLPIVTAVLAVLALLWLVAVPRWRHWIDVAAAAAVSAALAGAAYGLIEHVWRPFGDPTDVRVYVALGVVLFALGMAPLRTVRARRRGVVGTVSTIAVLAVIVEAAVQVNVIFAAYPTAGTLVGVPQAESVQLDELRPDGPAVTGRPLESAWEPPADMPDSGRVLTTDIPGAASGFDARDARIYLPPAYFTEPRPLLPVLVLLAGQPGSPKDWYAGGQLASTMEAFADEHDGLTPVTVVADGTGSETANPLCLDSRLGNVATYLSEDVPGWVRDHLQIDPDPRAWAVGGLSYGGTCALQLAVNSPDVYPTFVNLSGQDEPTLGDHKRTVNEAFGGDEAAFARVNPADLLQKNRYPDTAGAFVVGSDDGEFLPQVQNMYDAAERAGMDVHFDERPGGHSFRVWSEGLRGELDWLAGRLGLTGS